MAGMADIIGGAKRSYWWLDRQRRSSREEKQRLLIASILQGMQAAAQSAVAMSSALRGISSEERAEAAETRAKAGEERTKEAIKARERGDVVLTDLQNKIIEKNSTDPQVNLRLINSAWKDLSTKDQENEYIRNRFTRLRSEYLSDYITQRSPIRQAQEAAAEANLAESKKLSTPEGIADEIKTAADASLIRGKIDPATQQPFDQEGALRTAIRTIGLQPGFRESFNPNLPDQDLLNKSWRTGKELETFTVPGSRLDQRDVANLVEMVATQQLMQSGLPAEEWTQDKLADLLRRDSRRFSLVGVLAGQDGKIDTERISANMELLLSNVVKGQNIRAIPQGKDKNKWAGAVVDAAFRAARPERVIAGQPVSRLTAQTKGVVGALAESLKNFAPDAAATMEAARDRITSKHYALPAETAKRLNALEMLGLGPAPDVQFKPEVKMPGRVGPGLPAHYRFLDKTFGVNEYNKARAYRDQFYNETYTRDWLVKEFMRRLEEEQY